MSKFNRIALASIAALTTAAVTASLAYSSKDQQGLEQKLDQEVPINVLEGVREPVEYTTNKHEEVKPKEPDYRTDNFSKDSEVVLLARMIYGEAAGQAKEEKIAVGYTALTRANDGKKFNGTDVKSALFKGYDCFRDLEETLKNPMAHDPKTFRECLDVADGILSGRYEDPTHGATHYFNPDTSDAYWANGKYTEMHKIGRIETERGLSAHEFWKED